MAESMKKEWHTKSGPTAFAFFIAYFGAAVYFWNLASGFWGHIWALIKAIVWPAILVYNALQSFSV